MIAQFEKVICNNHTKHCVITILAGGTGSVKIVRGLAAHDSDINVITNVGDNYWLYGMYVCPDIDTIVYGLADLLDVERGWGVKKDTFNFLRQMEVFGEETWFRIGDRDAATHLMRTNKLKNGENLSNITKWLCEQFAVSANIIPVSDNNIETRITTNKGDLHLQEYWVKYRGREDVLGIQYVGADKARANPEARIGHTECRHCRDFARESADLYRTHVADKGHQKGALPQEEQGGRHKPPDRR